MVFQRLFQIFNTSRCHDRRHAKLDLHANSFHPLIVMKGKGTKRNKIGAYRDCNIRSRSFCFGCFYNAQKTIKYTHGVSVTHNYSKFNHNVHLSSNSLDYHQHNLFNKRSVTLPPKPRRVSRIRSFKQIKVAYMPITPKRRIKATNNCQLPVVKWETWNNSYRHTLLSNKNVARSKASVAHTLWQYFYSRFWTHLVTCLQQWFVGIAHIWMCTINILPQLKYGIFSFMLT